MNTLAVTFAQPALLLGICVCVVPLLMHFLLRPRPKRVVFPAMALFRQALATGQRARKLQDYRLLLVRMLLLAAAAALLAGPTCRQPETVLDGGPRAIAIVIDDSWSSSYRLDESSTVADTLRDAAKRVVQGWATDRQAVMFSLIRNAADASDVEPTADRAGLLPAIESLGSGPPHARGLGSAILRALRHLQTARQTARELVIVTDGAAHAWEDVPPKLLVGLASTNVRVITAPAGQRTNLAIRGVSEDSLAGREATPIPLVVNVLAAGVDAQVSLIARINGREVARASPIALSAGVSTDVPVVIPPQPLGQYAVSFDLDPPDRLVHDQRYYAVIDVRARPIAWLLVGATASDADQDLATTIVRNLLAPETLDPAAQAVVLNVLAADRELPSASESTTMPALIIVPSGVAVSDAQAEKIRRLVELGATLLLVCSSDTESADWPGLRTLLSTRVPQVEQLTAMTSIAAGEGGGGATAGMEELARCSVRWRLRLAELREGVTIEAYFGDDEPAIVRRRLGRGSVALLATSPDPRWSELGVRAAGLLEWLHGLMHRGEAVQTHASVITEAAIETLPFTTADRTQLTVARLAPTDNRTHLVRMVSGTFEPRLPTDMPGVYGVRSPRDESATPVYAVNWPVAESVLDSIEPERVKELLGSDRVTFETTEAIDDARGTHAQGATPVDPRQVLAAVLLVAVFAELWLARSPRTGRPPMTDVGV